MSPHNVNTLYLEQGLCGVEQESYWPGAQETQTWLSTEIICMSLGKLLQFCIFIHGPLISSQFCNSHELRSFLHPPSLYPDQFQLMQQFWLNSVGLFCYFNQGIQFFKMTRFVNSSNMIATFLSFLLSPLLCPITPSPQNKQYKVYAQQIGDEKHMHDRGYWSWSKNL